MIRREVVCGGGFGQVQAAGILVCARSGLVSKIGLQGGEVRSQIGRLTGVVVVVVCECNTI